MKDIQYNVNTYKPRVSVIILNWNGWRDTIECLESVYRLKYLNYDVIVVDNSSTDNSVERIKEYAVGKINITSKLIEYRINNKPIKVFEVFEDDAKRGRFNLQLYERYHNNRRMTLIRAKDNYGYTGGNNLGITFATSIFESEYILILNNDVVVDKECLSELLKASTEARAGIAGPKNYIYNNPNAFWFAWFDVDMRRGKPIIGLRRIDLEEYDQIRVYDQIRYVPFIAGSCLLIKRQVIEDVGLFDEKYFCYWDDVDYCIRARRAGYKILYVPFAKIWHKISSTAKSSAEYYIARNRFLFMKKHANDRELVLFLSWFFLIDFWTRIIARILLRREEVLKYFCRGVKDGIFLLIASERGKIAPFLRKVFVIRSQLSQYSNFNK